MTKTGLIGVLGHGVVDFGVGLSVHLQTRFKRLNLVVLASGIFLVVLNVLLGHNNSQWAV